MCDVSFNPLLSWQLSQCSHATHPRLLVTCLHIRHLEQNAHLIKRLDRVQRTQNAHLYRKEQFRTKATEQHRLDETPKKDVMFAKHKTQKKAARRPQQKKQSAQLAHPEHKRHPTQLAMPEQATHPAHCTQPAHATQP